MSKKPLTWDSIKIRLGDLKPNIENPKYSTDAGVSRLNDSIDTLGEFQPFVVAQDGLSLVDGHQRLNAWLKHKGEDFEVEAKRANRDLTKQEVHKIILYSGKGTLGHFDFDLLNEHFDDAELLEFGGFEEFEDDADLDDEFFRDQDPEEKPEEKHTYKLEYSEEDYNLLQEKMKAETRSREQIFYEALVG